jgi:hypothetical protein
MVFKDIVTKEIFKFHVGQPDWEKNCMEFMDGCDTLIMHNGIGYDFPALRKVWNYDYKGKKVDTLLISRLHNDKRPLPQGYKGKATHSVEAWGYRLGRGKPDHEDWSQFSDEMLHRCTEDVEIQYLIMLALHKEGQDGNWTNAYSLTFRLFEILQKQDEYGWKVDKPYMERCVGMLSHWMERIDRVIVPYLPLKMVIEESKHKVADREKLGTYKYLREPFLKSGKYSKATLDWLADAGYDYHDGSDVSNRIVAGAFSRVSYRTVDIEKRAEVIPYLLSEGWIPKKWNYKKDPKTKRDVKDENGNPIPTSPKLDKDDPFEGIEGRTGKSIAKRIQIKQRRGIMNGWLKIIRNDGRISAKVTGIAATGRMKHGGVVNVPSDEAFFGKQMRRCFTSEEGFTLVSADAASCQDRMLAQRAEVQEFTDMLLHGDKDLGTDGHSLAAKAVNSVLQPLGIPTITRKKGKNFNFAWKFGAQDPKLGGMVGRGKEVGSQIRDALRETFPAQAALVDKLTAEWRKNAKRTINKWGKVNYENGWIVGLDGRPIYIKYEYQILVYMLQSDEGIYMSTVYCIAYKDLMARFKWKEDFGIVCFYHDELTIEIREEYAEEAASIIENAFTKASNYFKMMHCPQAGEAAIGDTWLDVH